MRGVETVLFVAVGIVLLGVVVAAVVGWIPVTGVSAPERTTAHVPLRRGEIDSAALADLHFDQALRGYRQTEVDRALEDLARELEDRDAVIRGLHADLREARAHGAGATATADVPPQRTASAARVDETGFGVVDEPDVTPAHATTRTQTQTSPGPEPSGDGGRG